VVFEKDCIMRSSSEEWIATNGWRWLPWDDAVVVSAGKLRKLWDSLSELRSSLCERRLERTVPRPALLPVETAQFTQFLWGMTSHSKIAQFNWECIAPLTRYLSSCENWRYRDLWNKIQGPIRRNVAPSSKLMSSASSLKSRGSQHALSKVRVTLRSLFHHSLYTQCALTKDASCQNWVC
jgi:hypothetical protein